MKDTLLFISTIIIGIISGIFSHEVFNAPIEDTDMPKAIELPLRYGIGWLTGLPTYLLIRHVQELHHSDKTPMARQASDYVGLGTLIGVGIMAPRFWRWWRS